MNQQMPKWHINIDYYS